MDTDIRFSFVIVNFKSVQYLPACLASLKNLSGSGSFEVIIGNNDADEEKSLTELRRRFNFTIVPLERNVGFGSAANRSAEHAQGEFLVFLNPDARILSGNLSRLSSAFSRNTSVGAIGFHLLIEPERNQEWNYGPTISLARIVVNHTPFLGKRPEKIRRSFFQTSWVSGGAFAMPRDIFFNIHGFDERFFLYYEDVDICDRIRKYGKKIAVLDEFRVLHTGGGSMHSTPAQKEIYFRSQDRYFSIHRPKFEGILLRSLRKISGKERGFTGDRHSFYG